ncbi:hypothetical protein BN946_scf185027.g10 [Trametes cinnabarina]|uniref:SET domain-containing protein n=1 Tax=Pycnoporus cinnabarinus TaxID=5643 RepID=A0A060SNM5_PYCCI|nr:hypothetical protein BN946_scf185027.g10 [Trametes cinnabarina]
MIAPYPSTIISTAAYLSDPLNAYAHLGMPKPFVHLIGPPLDVALDARFTGDQSRFVRSGCRPNAVIRPVICQSTKKPTSNPEEMLSFGIFALRDLKPNEEVVLGWEWDDGNVVHHLPALIESPFAFPPHQIQQFRNQMTSMLHALSSTFTTCACGARARDCALTRMAEFVENQTPLTPSPSPPSQFTKDRNAARRGSAGGPSHADDGAAAHVDLGPLIGIERGFRTRERIPFSGGMGGVEMVPPPTPTSEAEAGPSRAKEQPTSATGRRVSFPDDLLSPPVKARRGKGKDRKGKARADDQDVTEESDTDGGRARAGSRTRKRALSSDPETTDGMDVDVDVEEVSPPPEEKLPPKLRKAWIRQSAERLQEHRRYVESHERGKNGGGSGVGDDAQSGGGAHSLFDSRDMPPPPVPPSRTPPLSSVPTNHPRTHHTPSPLTTTTASCSGASQAPSDGQASPSAPFSKLSLLSPVVPSTSPVFMAASPHLQSEAQDGMPTAAPAPPRKRNPTNSSQAGEAKEPAKKSKPRARKEKAKEKDKDAPSRAPKENEADEADMLKPSLVHKGSAKRKKSASSASVSPRVPVLDVASSPKMQSRASPALPSPATAPASLTPPPIVSLPISPSAATVTLLGAPVASDSPEEIKADGMQLDTPVVEDVHMRDAPAAHEPAVVAEDADVNMADEPPTSPAAPVRPASPAPTVPPAPSGADLLFSLADAAVAARDGQPAPTEPHSAPEPEPASASRPISDAPSAHPEPLSEATEPPAADPQRPKSPTPPPPPPPPPKVKLSLKDFALRKRKQREEREKEEKERALATPTPSPVVTVPALPQEGAGGAEGTVAVGSVPAVSVEAEKQAKPIC